MKNVLLGISLLTLTVVLSVALAMRAVWIQGKISALSSPPSEAFADDNVRLLHKSSKPRVVLIGDSRIAQWPPHAWTEPWEIVNRGIAGETAAQLAKRFQHDAIALHPHAIVIESGINDLIAASFMGKPARRGVVNTTAKNLRELAEIGAASGSSVFVATIIPPARPDALRLLVWRNTVRSLVAELNSQLRQAQLPTRVKVVDLSILLDVVNDKSLPAYLSVDTLHLNDVAYQRITATLEPLMVNAVGNIR